MLNIRFGRCREEIVIIDQLVESGARGAYLRHAMRVLGIEQPCSKWAANHLSIRCESSLTGGENIGGSAAAHAAPEVAADDDDGDGDGDADPEPEPERQTQPHPITLRRTQPHHRPESLQSNSCRLNKSHREANMEQKAAIPYVVEYFDRVSDSTHVDIAALKAITGKSRATLYRWIDKGLLPKPRKLGPTHNFWTAGEIRRALSA